ncbi:MULTISPECIES: hypothetical protein [Microbacterium]|uniref:hypothetical protein n=1 Tax=Microbacterium TaxID=33882 RepID=UPI0012BA34F7|nr:MULTISPECIES: hypothetical protein [Microbacterium]MTE24200.1 hypothetical protein [Microbacterium sp. ZXX196]NHI15941.1 hypothetical protein [Microbacterium excoecariae]
MARKRRGGIVLGALGGVLVLGGAAILAGVAFAPEQVERTYGAVKTSIDKTVDEVQEQVFEELPTVTIGVEGGLAELDRCDGTFTIMRSYEREGVPETGAAHNNCGGDVLLAWDEGQKIRIAGRDEVYEVVDIRYTSKIWSSTDDLVGLGGDIALQSCFYGEDRMKFVGLAPVEES